MSRSVSSYAHQICAAVEGLRDLLADPSVDFFDANEAELVRALNALNQTDGLFGSFAYAADIAEASRRVGSTRTSDYLQRRLDTSFVQAMRWLDIGAALHGAAPEKDPVPGNAPLGEGPGAASERGLFGTNPGVTPEGGLFASGSDATSGDGLGGENLESGATPEAERSPEAEEQAARELRNEQKEREKRQRRRGISNAKLTIIRDALRHLEDAIVDSVRPGLFEKACDQAPDRTPEDLRMWVQREVRRANAAVADPLKDIRNRSMSWSKPDHHGNTTVKIVLPRFAHALLDTLFAPQNLVAWRRSVGTT